MSEVATMERLLTAREVAAWLQVSVNWVSDHASGVRKPLLPSVKMGPGKRSARRFRRDAVQAFIDRYSAGAACPPSITYRQIRVDEAFKRVEKGRKRIGGTKTEGTAAPEWVAISESLEAELREWMRSQHISGDRLLFPNSRGGVIDPSNYLERVLQPLGITAKIPDLTYQALRRTCATYFRGDLKGAQAQLRHTTPHITARNYQQVITSEHRASVERLDAELCGNNAGESKGIHAVEAG